MKKIIVAHTYLFPNGMVVTFNTDLEQVPELQGKYTTDLYEKISDNDGI